MTQVYFKYYPEEIGHLEKGIMVAANDEEMDNMMKNAFPAHSKPNINLDKHVAVGIFMGECPTGGYSIKINSVYVKGPHLIVNATFKEPGPDEFVIQILTYPGKILIIEEEYLNKVESVILENEDGNIISSYSIDA